MCLYRPDAEFEWLKTGELQKIVESLHLHLVI